MVQSLSATYATNTEKAYILNESPKLISERLVIKFKMYNTIGAVCQFKQLNTA